MRRIILTVIMLIAVVSPALVGTAAAQSSMNGTATAAPSTPEATQTIELSPTTRIKSWSFSNGTFSLVVEADIPTRIAITDAGELSRILSEGDGAAAGKARVRRMTLTPGTTVVKFRAESVGDASAITVSSSNADGIVAIRSDAIKAGNPPVEYGTVQTLLASTAVAAAGGTFLWVRKKRDEKQLEVEREW
ncbi:hypothetical protein DVK03_01670 [Haloferax sp. Atlit-109R]|uniref:Uncharacterized protein n=3 Tax=Haloferax TaxID=2251 RepID=A0A558G9U9_HALVO|nr:hypothetical protein DEQ67_16670 [Haloferax sp. Atlit-48N]RDZ36832.1 hypothetical protein C5B88_01670 [Haloferax sp. Atlit-24N]RDZ42963.1 hypothetical protein C5B86_14855 [Haloferax sp. Atlit-19N]RLM37630.1 hypothetical protein DVK03_01670 [Haloferax sp. Atlit-109R]RLM45571.1 hypothetical protein DVK04_01685 [Haloferax sp. Atlit-105R]TVT94540.1 hypothetical protein FQA18_11300 [Haloferax volcanii]GGC52369.1 hypothetical protein GCM10007209_12550 [Haloferax sulfurifontis]